ncbi:unnamed protein product, partial [Ascophyllum nodosum]
RFSKDDVSSSSQVKSSVQRGIRAKLIEQFPNCEAYLEDILPKKANVTVAKCKDRVSLICCDGVPLFFQQRDGLICPTLRTLHKYPNMMPTMTVDKGAISFVMNGANIMCQGFTSKGGRIDCSLEAGSLVCIMAEGKKVALAVGITTMSTDEIRGVNKGSGVENLHFLGDGLFGTKELD